MDKLLKKILLLIAVFLSMHIFILNIKIIEIPNNIINNNHIFLFFYQFRMSLNSIDLKTIILFILVYYFFKNTLFKKNKIDKFTLLLSIYLTTISIIGKCYLYVNSSISVMISSPVQIYKSILLFTGYLITYYIIIEKIKTLNIKKIYIPKDRIERIWNKHPAIITSIMILLCWLPYIIIFYPGGATGDTADSVLQFFHSDYSWSIQSIRLINKNVYINKHHSVLFTILLGNFIKLGRIIKSNNFGFFLFILFQVITITSIFTYLIYYLKKIKTPLWLILCSLLYISISPIIIKYSLTAVKDTLSASFTLLYVIFVHQIVNNYENFLKNKKKVFLLIITILLVMMFRNNGIFTIITPYPFLIIICKKNRKKLISILSLTLIAFNSYNNILLPNLEISNGSVKEILSVPFQQLARTAKYRKEDFTKDEINKINKVLDFEDISNMYNPNLSDDVKNTYKYTATNKDLYNLYKIWLKYFKKYSNIYIDSFFNSTYLYFYPENTSEPKIIFANYLSNQEDIPFKPYKKFKNQRNTANYILTLICNNPLTIYFNIVGIIDELLIISVICMIKNRKYKNIIPLLPLLSVLLVCLVSPVNGCDRYILPLFFSLPIIIQSNIQSKIQEI